MAVHPAGFLLLNQSSQADFLDHVICNFSLGYSGGGFSLSPWVGSVMSRFIVDGVKSPEMHLLRLKRFEEGQLLAWGNVK